jgi:hypothetical protein
MDLMVRLTPESLTELFEVVERTIGDLAARDGDDPRAEQVALFLAGLPVGTGLPAGEPPAREGREP